MNKKMSILIFSGEYDKALAALILANTALEMNVEVTIFFAFWGLTLVRDPDVITDEEKTAYEKMFSNMTPKGIEDLPLSKMNFAGIGKKMLQDMMDDNDTPRIQDFLKGAINKGAKFGACKLSCEIMGFEKRTLPSKIITAEDYIKDALESEIQIYLMYY